MHIGTERGGVKESFLSVCEYYNLLKLNRSTLINKPTSLYFNQGIAIGEFSLEGANVYPNIYAVVHVVMFNKKHRISSTVQEEKLTNDGRHHLLLLHNQVHHKMQAYIHA